MRHWTVRTRLLAGFGFLLVLLAMVGTIATLRVTSLRHTVDLATREVAGKVRAANDLIDAVNEAARFKLALFAATSDELIAKSSEGVAQSRERINASYARLDSIVADTTGATTDTTMARQIVQIKALRKIHAASFDSAAAIRKRGDIAVAEGLLTSEVLPSLNEYVGAISGLVARQDSALAAEAAAADQQATRGIALIVGLCALAIVAGLAVALFIYRSITQPLAQLTQVANQLAEGDCNVVIDQQGAKDEVAELAVAMQRMAQADAQLASVAQSLADGDVSVNIHVRGSQDVLGSAMTRVKSTLVALDEEMSALTDAAVAGRLQERANTASFRGSFRELMIGLNTVLDNLLAPVNEARTTLERLATRDLSARMSTGWQGDHNVLATSLNTAAEALDVTLAEVASSAQQVNAASLQIADGSQGLARSASDQAASLEEVASGLQEVSAVTRQNAQYAAEAQQLTHEAQQSSSRGVEEMGRLSDAIARIKQASDATARIVKTIDEIAFQTNLLALNAAVEAARAGDAGRGFAVVAEEVRSLALRSAEAARQTSELIEQAVVTAGEGVTRNDLVLGQLHEIDRQVTRVGAVMVEVASASQQQREGISTIEKAVDLMNGVTQQVAANAEESASAAEELASQATTMTALIGEFALTDASAQRRGAQPSSRSAARHSRQRLVAA
ncbi:MAG: HAMP domain-containing protein [Gemmatimonadaceae bacterium]|nr:HAMP domain-containing protein [Gemmatimonadaceae bacterium]